MLANALAEYSSTHKNIFSSVSKLNTSTDIA